MSELPYEKCPGCIDRPDGDLHLGCEGMDETKPLCGCRCPWLEGETNDRPTDGRSQFEQPAS